MYLSGFAATHWPVLIFIALLILGGVGIVQLDKPGKRLVRWWLATILTVVSAIMGFVCPFIGTNIQGSELRQQAKATYGAQLTDNQARALLVGNDEEVILSQEGARATVQKVHLIKEQDSNRWLLETRGPKHIKRVPLRTELPKIG